MRLTPYEQETIISFNEGEPTASVYTHNRALINKLHKLAEEHPEACRLIKESHEGRGKEYLIPKRWIRIHPPRKTSPLTDEQKAAVAERFRKSRQQNQ